MPAKYTALLRPVGNRGMPPTKFLDELIAWVKTAPDEIFDVNDEPGDVMGKLVGILGPWEGKPKTPERLLHRKCCMLELLRCLGGHESSWRWNEGVDTTNKTSMSHIEGRETGVFQVSWNSLWLEKKHHTLRDLLKREGVSDTESFIGMMKLDHKFALEYAARLLRISYRWSGPTIRNEVDSNLSRAAVQEFKRFL